MRALTYIALIAVIVWAGFAWEQVEAPLVVVNEREAPATAEPEAQPPSVALEKKSVEEEASEPGPLVGSQAALPVPPPAPLQVEYNEAYVEALELAIHARINEERALEGVGTLKYDDTLAQVAAYHSTDMATKDYFTHEDEDGCNISCRVDSAGYKWQAVGENLFLLKRDPHFTVEGASAIVVAGWMGSPGHRKNMFEKKFTHQGIGVVILDDSIYVTEVLALPR